MEEFKKIWEEVLMEIVIPKGYLKTRLETMEDQILISKAFQYCVIMRTKEGLEEFLDYNGLATDFFIKLITELLNLQNETEEKRDEIIKNYLKFNIIDNGFVCHTTNSLSAENIMINGFTKRQTDEHTQDVITELKEIFPEGFFRTDLNYILEQEERTGWFYDRSPYHYKRYSNGPEWFKRLVLSSNFTRRDYEGAQRFVLEIMDLYDESLSQKQKALEFLDKYWNIYAPTTPHMLLISTKDNELRNDMEIKSVEELSLREQIRYYIDRYFKETDKNTDKEVLPTNIIDIDMNELEKRMQNNYSK